MPSRAVIIGASEFQQGPEALASHDSFGESVRKYFEILDSLAPFQGNCTVIPPEGGRVDQVSVEVAIKAAAEEAKGADETLLVVYVGHGRAWPDIHDNLVHLAMYGSREDMASGWLEYSAIRRAMYPKQDGLRIFIADCCYSNLLPSMGSGDDTYPERTFALMERDQGTAIFTALDPNRKKVIANPLSCGRIDPDFKDCTHFSGHLLQVLSRGSRFAGDMLSLGDVRDEIRIAMRDCHFSPLAGLILRGPADSTPFVENCLSPDIPRELPKRTSREDWVTALRSGRSWPIETLMADPHIAAKVSLALWDSPEGRANAKRIDEEAIKLYADHLDDYLIYWNVRDGLERGRRQ
ncbi:hypothetical protein ABH920_008964 [Catenulispora sp. EB89]|uniref:hypothetical protein n=1 Tax=Catenulispora sp. EB89 TaxID=3156257 RepID=UPI0035197673